jgi:hypothetical protein
MQNEHNSFEKKMHVRVMKKIRFFDFLNLQNLSSICYLFAAFVHS